MGSQFSLLHYKQAKTSTSTTSSAGARTRRRSTTPPRSGSTTLSSAAMSIIPRSVPAIPIPICSMRSVVLPWVSSASPAVRNGVPPISMSRSRAMPSTRTTTMASAAAATRSTTSLRDFGSSTSLATSIPTSSRNPE